MIVVIGCGNTNRSDDGAGVWVVRELAARGVPEHVRLIEAGAGGIDVMLNLEGAQRVIIVDAAEAGAAPGRIFRVPVAELATAPQGSLSLHSFRWDHALALGRVIYGDRFPTHIDVFLIQVASLDAGTELTPAVHDAAQQVVALVAAEIAQPR